jgi:hypothetical protein
MNFLYENELHKVIYIEYQDGIPHSVITHTPHNVPEYWDFEESGGKGGTLHYFNSGSGGSGELVFECPQYGDEYKGGSVWVAKGAVVTKGKSNVKILKYPRLLKHWDKGSRNPFTNAWECFSFDYCSVCEAHHADDYCREHLYEDDNGDLRYFHNDEKQEE